jgi:hypothetical protein
MSKHPMIEQLIDAQLDFLDQQFSQSETIQQEFLAVLSLDTFTTTTTYLVI